MKVGGGGRVRDTYSFIHDPAELQKELGFTAVIWATAKDLQTPLSYHSELAVLPENNIK